MGRLYREPTKELSPTIRANAGDNQVAVAYEEDWIMYPQDQGGVQRYSLSTVSENNRSIMCNRLQMGTTRTSDARETDRVREVIRGCWTLDEKMGNTYCHYEQANTLAQRDYKQPQAVVYESDEHRNISLCDGDGDNSATESKRL